MEYSLGRASGWSSKRSSGFVLGTPHSHLRLHSSPGEAVMGGGARREANTATKQSMLACPVLSCHAHETAGNEPEPESEASTGTGYGRDLS